MSLHQIDMEIEFRDLQRRRNKEKQVKMAEPASGNDERRNSGGRRSSFDIPALSIAKAAHLDQKSVGHRRSRSQGSSWRNKDDNGRGYASYLMAFLVGFGGEH